MVKTSTDVMDINPLERMGKLEEISTEKRSTLIAKKKELEELEKQKKLELEELEQKKKLMLEDMESKKGKGLKELETKKKELEDLEKKKSKEIEETEQLIESSFQELMRHKRLIIAEEDEKQLAARKESNIEEVVESAPKSGPEVPRNVDYSKFFKELEPPRNLYQAANSGFYNSLLEFRDRALSGDFDEKDQEFISKLRKTFESFNNEGYIKNRDPNQYVQRIAKVIEEIDTSIYYR